MQSTQAAARCTGRRGCVMAMVLGTALSGLASAPGSAASPPETTRRAVEDISRYCTTCWRNARLQRDCWQDCTQEVFCRLLERVGTRGWEHVLKEEASERRELLRAIDAVKKRSQRCRNWLPYQPETLADTGPTRERHLAEQHEALWQAAQTTLSDRQRQILQLSLDGWPVAEIGTKLQVPVERVSDEKYKAIRKLREQLSA